MNRFLYFIPNCPGVPDMKRIRHAQFEHAFPQMGACGQLQNGPGSEPGQLIAFGDGADLAYRPDQQAWIKTVAGCWVGMPRDKSKQPSPNDLVREQTTEGSLVLLADGNEWLVPILRFWNGDTRFPQVLTIGEDGMAHYEIAAEYRTIFELANEMVHKSLKGEGGKFSADDHMRLATEALKRNYRIGPYEISLLGLIDSINVQKIADAALDGPNLRSLVEEFKKKSQSGTEPLPGSGTGASASPTTGQP